MRPDIIQYQTDNSLTLARKYFQNVNNWMSLSESYKTAYVEVFWPEEDVDYSLLNNDIFKTYLQMYNNHFVLNTTQVLKELKKVITQDENIKWKIEWIKIAVDVLGLKEKTNTPTSITINNNSNSFLDTVDIHSDDIIEVKE